MDDVSIYALSLSLSYPLLLLILVNHSNITIHSIFVK